MFIPVVHHKTVRRFINKLAVTQLGDNLRGLLGGTPYTESYFFLGRQDAIKQSRDTE
jgi:hypothetical protein